MRQVSIEGLPVIGAGANGSVYRLNGEQILKVYNPLTNSLEKIRREKETAKQALIHGIPTAISFDIVQVGEKYGMIYELIDAEKLGTVVAKNPDRLEEMAVRMAECLKGLHATEFEEGILPDAHGGLLAGLEIAENSGYYEEGVISLARRVVERIPKTNTFIHGDFHPGNIMVSRDEFFLIDVGDAGVGDPLIDLLGACQIMLLVPRRPGAAEIYTGLPGDMLLRLWDVFIRAYTGITDQEELDAFVSKLKFFAKIRSIPGITISALITVEEKKRLVSEVVELLQKEADLYFGE